MNTAAVMRGGRGPYNAVEVHAGDLRLALRTDLGGSIAALWHRGTPALRSTEPGSLTTARQSTLDIALL